MVAVPEQLRPSGFATTERRDAWWVAPLVQGLVLAVLIGYANWAAYQGVNYQAGGYLSPLYSPLIPKPAWFPLSSAFLILLPPVLFRATCYYYRKAYYRSYFLDPPACAAGDLRGHGYRGRDGLSPRPPEPPPLPVLPDARVPAVPLGRRRARVDLRRSRASLCGVPGLWPWQEMSEIHGSLFP